MTQGLSGFMPIFQLRPQGQSEEHLEDVMETIFTWEALRPPAILPGPFVPVSATLEDALLHGHLDLGQHYGQFAILRLEVSNQAWATWTVHRPDAARKHRPVNYHTGALREALEAQADLIWIARESVYRQEPLGQAERLKHSRPYYQILTEGGVIGTCTIQRVHKETSVELKLAS